MTTSSVAYGKSGTAAPISPTMPLARQVSLVAAAVGALLVVMAVIAVARWIPTAHQITAYRDHNDISWYAARVYEIGGVAMSIWVIFYLVKQWHEKRRLTVDMLICIGGAVAYIFDLNNNFLQPNWLYSSQWININTVTAHEPGWLNPVTDIPSPAVMILLYTFGLLAFSMIINQLMRLAQRRFPAISNVGLIAVAFASAVVIDLALEIPMFALGLWSQGAAPDWMRFGTNSAHVVVLAEVVLAAVMFAAYASLRYFKNDQGYSVVERSGYTGFKGTAVKMLCAITFVVGFELFGNFGQALTGLYSSPFPPNIPAHQLNGQCGKGTAYGVCPGDPTYKMPIGHMGTPGT